MKYRVLIRAFTLRRDLGCTYLLARLLERRGCEVIVASVRSYQPALRLWKPHVVVVNTLGQITPTRETSPHSLVVFWPGEGAQPWESSDALLFRKHPEYYDNSDLILPWGSTPTEMILEETKGRDSSKVITCGNPRLDLIKFNSEELVKLRDPKSIGILGKYSRINQHRGRPTMASLLNDVNESGVIREVISFCCMLTAAKRILEEPDLRLSLRPYPTEAPNTYREYVSPWLGKRFELDESFDFARWAAGQSKVISETSTTLIETYLTGTPVINIDPLISARSQGMARSWSDFEPQKTGHAAGDLDELMSLLQSDLPPSPRSREMDTFLEDFCDWFSPESAVMRASHAIMELLEQSTFSSSWRWPKVLVDLRDTLSFHRAMWRSPSHANMNYYRGYHQIPSHLDHVVANIQAGRSVFSEHGSVGAGHVAKKLPHEEFC